MLRATLVSTLAKAAAAGACFLALGSAATADVYKYVDEQGNVQYTDKPRTLPAERLNVQTRRTDTVAVQARQAEEMERMQAASQAYQQNAQQRAAERGAAEEAAQAQAERCAQARERYERYMTSQRLYEPLPDGERRYLSDAELDAARAAAKTSMDEACK